MADNNKGPGKGNAADNAQAGSSKPGSGPAKKPTPILDLKATEVRGAPAQERETTSERAKFAATNLKGAPDAKPQTSGGAATSTTAAVQGTAKAGAAVSGVPVTGGGRGSGEAAKASAASDEAAKAAVTTGTGGAARGGSAAQGGAGASGQGNASGAGSGGQGSAGSGGGNGGDKAMAAPPSPPRRSGGGFFSTVTHLVAGIIGGGIALYAAGPIEKQLGFKIAPDPAVPAQIEQRIAALESRPAAAPEAGVKPEQVAQISAAIAAANARLDELARLNEQVTALSQDVEGVRAAQRQAPTGGAGGEASADTRQLQARLDKLENALTTLSSATGANGQQNAIAPLAQFSSKIADLEQSLNIQIGEVRQSLLQEIEGKVAQSSEASQQAQAGTQRIDREVAALKTDTARLEQRAETLRAASDKIAQTLRAVTEQAADIKVELDTLKGDVEQQFTKVARPSDVEQAIAPVSEKIASIQKDLGAVVESEKAREANAERIVLSLELANLKRVLDRGQAYAQELADVKKVAGEAIDFSALQAHAEKGVATTRELTRRFQEVAYRIINSDAVPVNGSVMDRLLSGAKSIVQVRRTDVPKEADGTEAAVARIEQHMKQGELTKALAEANKLPETGRAAAKDWISELEARASVDQAIAKVEDQLKASLGGAKPPGKQG